jgi:hypothetical protein
MDNETGFIPGRGLESSFENERKASPFAGDTSKHWLLSPNRNGLRPNL